MSIESKPWYQKLVRIGNLPSHERYKSLEKLHHRVYRRYITAIKTMSDETANEISSDGRTRAIVVAHILAWEEWQVQVFGAPDPIRAVSEQMQLRAYQDPETEERLSFSGVDNFNAYQAEKYHDWSWQNIHQCGPTLFADSLMPGIAKYGSIHTWAAERSARLRV